MDVGAFILRFLETHKVGESVGLLWRLPMVISSWLQVIRGVDTVCPGRNHVSLIACVLQSWIYEENYKCYAVVLQKWEIIISELISIAPVSFTASFCTH